MKPLGQVLCSDNTSARVLTLSRPRSMNALTLKMVRELFDYYIVNPHRLARAVYILRGEGIRSFCAGGDAFALSGEIPINEHREYYSEIYRLFHHIASQSIARDKWNEAEFKHHYSTSRSNITSNSSNNTSSDKAFRDFSTNIAIWRGHVYGNGVGLSLHGSHRVACESTLFAMPEVKYGLLPDAGSCWKFARLPLTGLGAYLALTGNIIKGADTLHAGLATHYVDSTRMRELEKDLYEVHGPHEVEECLASHAVAVPPFLLAMHARTLTYAFDVQPETTLPEIMEKLKEDGSPFARMALDSLKDNCPTSMATALEMLKCHREIPDIHSALEFDSIVIKRMCSLNVFRRGVEYALRHSRVDPEWPEPDTRQIDVEAIKRNLESILNEVLKHTTGVKSGNIGNTSGNNKWNKNVDVTTDVNRMQCDTEETSTNNKSVSENSKTEGVEKSSCLHAEESNKNVEKRVNDNNTNNSNNQSSSQASLDKHDEKEHYSETSINNELHTEINEQVKVDAKREHQSNLPFAHEACESSNVKQANNESVSVARAVFEQVMTILRKVLWK